MHSMSLLPAATIIETKSTTLGLAVVEVEARVRQEKLNDLLWIYLVSSEHLNKPDVSHTGPSNIFIPRKHYSTCFDPKTYYLGTRLTPKNTLHKHMDPSYRSDCIIPEASPRKRKPNRETPKPQTLVPELRA